MMWVHQDVMPGLSKAKEEKDNNAQPTKKNEREFITDDDRNHEIAEQSKKCNANQEN